MYHLKFPRHRKDSYDSLDFLKQKKVILLPKHLINLVFIYALLEDENVTGYPKSLQDPTDPGRVPPHGSWAVQDFRSQVIKSLMPTRREISGK